MSKSTPSPGSMIRGQSSRLIRFGDFEVNIAAGELRKNGTKIKLQDQPFRVLVALLARPGEVVTREELRAELWPDDTYVDFDRSLNTAVNKLREALGDSASHPKMIETFPRRGYRFVGQVDGTPVSAIDPRAATAQTETSKEAALVRARQQLKLALIACTVLLGLVLVAIFVAGFGLRTGSEPAQPLKFVLAPGEDVHDPGHLSRRTACRLRDVRGRRRLVDPRPDERTAPRDSRHRSAQGPFGSPDTRSVGFGLGDVSLPKLLHGLR